MGLIPPRIRNLLKRSCARRSRKGIKRGASQFRDASTLRKNAPELPQDKTMVQEMPNPNSARTSRKGIKRDVARFRDASTPRRSAQELRPAEAEAGTPNPRRRTSVRA